MVASVVESSLDNAESRSRPGSDSPQSGTDSEWDDCGDEGGHDPAVPAIVVSQESLASLDGTGVEQGTPPDHVLRSNNPYLHRADGTLNPSHSLPSMAELPADSVNMGDIPSDSPSRRAAPASARTPSPRYSMADFPLPSNIPHPGPVFDPFQPDDDTSLIDPTAAPLPTPAEATIRPSNQTALRGSYYSPPSHEPAYAALSTSSRSASRDHARLPSRDENDKVQVTGQATDQATDLATDLATIQVTDLSPPRQDTPRDPLNETPPRDTITQATTQAPLSRDPSQASRDSHTYQVKRVSWTEADRSLRRQSPVLMQSVNGPCPLLALVNALVLSTRHDAPTALVQGLNAAEHVSLDRLLDLVFEELMSAPGVEQRQLPDVTDLYAFLRTLSSGMNVNPQFVAPVLASSSSAALSADTFDSTRELELYSTFSVPLLHGWLPSPAELPVVAAFERSGRSYEEVQTLLLRQDELESKLSSPDGLTSTEQQTLLDLETIQAFLTRWPTQLSQHGLSVITEAVPPGRFAIVFRNDHFLTVYREPESRRLFSLVTDAGFLTHDEIVWESMEDVSGEACAFYSGDFRPVSQGVSAEGGDRVGSTSMGTSQGVDMPPASLTEQEQEDGDFALALQLQEQEEDRQRQLQQRRQREDQQSQQALRPALPARPQTQLALVDARPPPSYAQSASERPPTSMSSAAPGRRRTRMTMHELAEESRRLRHGLPSVQQGDAMSSRHERRCIVM